MTTEKQIIKKKFFRKASSKQRLRSAIVLFVLLTFFAIAKLAAAGTLNIGKILGPCGFQQKHNLPCPTCGMTRSAIAFADGQFAQSFYIQPAGGLLYTILAITAFLAFLIAAFGVYFRFLDRFFTEVKIKHVVLALVVIVAAGWLVTLARAMADKY